MKATMSAHRPTVLILASDPAFAREITKHWPGAPVALGEEPEFIVLDDRCFRGIEGNDYDLAIADASFTGRKCARRKTGGKEASQGLRQALADAGKPAIVVHRDSSREICKIDGSIVELRRQRGIWPAIAGLVGHEVLRRHQAESCTREAERNRDAAQAEATLGRYMVEMRTNVNNALTTVLGNAELLAHEPGLPATVQSQADAIRNMALRLHEIFQRFSSLEKELGVANRDKSSEKGNQDAAGRG